MILDSSVVSPFFVPFPKLNYSKTQFSFGKRPSRTNHNLFLFLFWVGEKPREGKGEKLERNQRKIKPKKPKKLVVVPCFRVKWKMNSQCGKVGDWWRLRQLSCFRKCRSIQWGSFNWMAREEAEKIKKCIQDGQKAEQKQTILLCMLGDQL